MNSQLASPPRRRLQPGEKTLLALSLLAVFALAVLGMRRTAKPHYAAVMATPEVACRSLVKAMLNQDETQVRRLTTPHGYTALQAQIKSSPFQFYPQLANRIVAEWGRSIYWEEDDLMRKKREESGFCGMSRTVKPNEKVPVISLKRTPEGWKLDDYVPGPDRLMQRAARYGHPWNLNQ